MRALPGGRFLTNAVLVLLAAVVAVGAVLVLTKDRSAPAGTVDLLSPATSAPTAAPTPDAVGDDRVKAVVFGDSIVAGANAGQGNPIFGELAASALGWRVSLFGYPGSGYTTAGVYKGGRDYITRIEQLRGYDIQVLVLEGGLNDTKATSEAFQQRVEAVLDRLGTLLPDVQVVLMGPWQPGKVEPDARRISEVLRSIAEDRSLPFVDPIGEKWVTTANAKTYIAADGLYPNKSGHAYFGERLARDLRRLLPARLVNRQG